MSHLQKKFHTKRGLLQHFNTCRLRNTANLDAYSNNESDENNDNEVQEPEQQHEDLLEYRSGKNILERSGKTK